jgi:hypothetical protein
MNNRIVRKDVFSRNGKLIRDAIHGDIFVPNKFLEIIDTPEFQRLRRIKQLSVANMLFPSANHTRFSHSLGTYYIMSKIIKHFEFQFKEMNLTILDADKDIALVAALLHDIGHGPFSHAFEGIHPNPDKNKKHEGWTIDIITKESELNKVLKKNFTNEFPQDVANFIVHQRAAKQIAKNNELEKIDLFTVLSSLVSGQLDADRMDYLLRDSINTGVSFGNIDIDRIISSLRITVSDDKFFVCVPEKYLADVEEYLLSRYQMHKSVYYHDFKVEMEKVIKKIFARVYTLYQDNKEICMPSSLRKIFEEDELSIDDYINIDDSTLVYAFQEWYRSNDEILSDLCNTILYREKYERLNILDESSNDIGVFKIEIINLLKKYNYKLIDFDKEYFWIESCSKFSIYKTNKENILILQSNGTLNDISEVSKVIVKIKGSDKVLEEKHNLTYINHDMLLHLVKEEHREQLSKEIIKIVNRYDNRNHIEIEKKYFFEKVDVFHKVEKVIKNTEYELVDEGRKEQIDLYYDTAGGLLESIGSTLRVRKRGENYQLTIKKPTSITELNENSQSERFEHQIKIESSDILLHKGFIKEYIPLTDNELTSLEETLTIQNNRKKFIVKKNKVEFEMVFDDVKYINANGKETSEYQVEVELKSEYQHKVNLKMLTDVMEKEVPDLQIANDSKYIRGLHLTRND